MSQTVMKAGRWVQAQINNILVLFIECNDARTHSHVNAYKIQQTCRLLKPTNPNALSAKPKNDDEAKI